MSIKNSIPNFVTCCSLISGCIACIMALRGNLPMATLWIVIAAVFDFGDGFAARSLHAYSPMGKELDSLSDMVSFGVAPGMIVYWLLEQACMTAPVLGEAAGYVPYMALVIPVFPGCVSPSSISMKGRRLLLSVCLSRLMLFSGRLSAMRSILPYQWTASGLLPER